MILNLGITGTREGLNKKQEENLYALVEKLLAEKDYEEVRFHHGQCQGVDVEAAKILRKDFKCFIVSHPPVKQDLIGQCTNDVVLKPKGYLARDRAIVESSDILLAFPKHNTKQPTGGTWYTYGYAAKQGVRSFLCTPDGKIVETNYNETTNTK